MRVCIFALNLHVICIYKALDLDCLYSLAKSQPPRGNFAAKSWQTCTSVPVAATCRVVAATCRVVAATCRVVAMTVAALLPRHCHVVAVTLVRSCCKIPAHLPHICRSFATYLPRICCKIGSYLQINTECETFNILKR
jgi:ABC-type sulfate transport system permease component